MRYKVVIFLGLIFYQCTLSADVVLKEDLYYRDGVTKFIKAKPRSLSQFRAELIQKSKSIYLGEVTAIIEEPERLPTGDLRLIKRAYVEIDRGWKKPKKKTIKIDAVINLEGKTVASYDYALKVSHTYLFFENSVGVYWIVLLDNPKDPALGYSYDFRNTSTYQLNVKYINDLGKPHWLYAGGNFILSKD
ncbi:hypothetical protein [Pleionea sediminis]|uniref:hypothetical protein n=1 Tax=Pleionea sediminis TaxID=2569479 RepID=UPI001184D9EF|nr:hypothetical protein [Pleionea sediminis]